MSNWNRLRINQRMSKRGWLHDQRILSDMLRLRHDCHCTHRARLSHRTDLHNRKLVLDWIRLRNGQHLFNQLLLSDEL